MRTLPFTIPAATPLKVLEDLLGGRFEIVFKATPSGITLRPATRAAMRRLRLYLIGHRIPFQQAQ